MQRAAQPWLIGLALVLIAVTVVGPLDEWSRRSFVGHMVVHLTHTDLTAPLILFALPWLGRRLRVVPSAVSLLCAVALVWSIHLGPLFELSLENDALHFVVDGLFLLAGVLMWAPVFDSSRLPAAARLLYVFIAMPLTGALGFVMHAGDHVLYAHYAVVCGAGALADQQAGAVLMWVGGSGAMFVGFMWLACEYARHEIRLAEAAPEPLAGTGGSALP